MARGRSSSNQVFDYRNLHELGVNVACFLSLVVLAVVASSALFGIPLTNNQKGVPLVEFFTVCPFLVGFSLLLAFRSMRFWKEKITIDGDNIIWIDRLGKVRCHTTRQGVRHLEKSFVLEGSGWVVHTDYGDIFFDEFINRSRILHEIFRFPLDTELPR